MLYPTEKLKIMNALADKLHMFGRTSIFRPYLFVMLIMSAICFLEMNKSNHVRSIASDCSEIIKNFFKNKKSKNTVETIIIYQKRENLWNEMNDSLAIKNFDINEYQKALTRYEKIDNISSINNPSIFEHKYALIEILTNKILLDSDFNNKYSDLSLKQIKRIEKLFTKYDFSRSYYRNKTREFTIELFEIVYGNPKSFKEFLTTKELSFPTRINRLIEENLLTNGLNGLIDKIPVSEKIKLKDRFKLSIDYLLKYKIIKLALFLPYYLPTMKPINLPDSLLKNILLNGIDKHESELKAYFKKQNRIDDYNNFRKIYTPIAYSVGIYVYYNTITNKVWPYVKEKFDHQKMQNELDEIVHSNK